MLLPSATRFMIFIIFFCSCFSFRFTKCSNESTKFMSSPATLVWQHASLVLVNIYVKSHLPVSLSALCSLALTCVRNTASPSTSQTCQSKFFTFLTFRASYSSVLLFSSLKSCFKFLNFSSNRSCLSCHLFLKLRAFSIRSADTSTENSSLERLNELILTLWLICYFGDENPRARRI